MPAPSTCVERAGNVICAYNGTMAAEQMKRIQVNDERLTQITRFNNAHENFPEDLAQAWDTLKPLIAYSEGQWSRDLAETDAAYGVLSEDGVWNEMGNFYDLLKELSQVSTRIIEEYEGENAVE